MLHPDASLSRRAWLSCPRCCPDGCSSCVAGDLHWQYLLANEAQRLLLQCPNCFYQRWHDTGFGAGGSRPDRNTLPDFPPRRGHVA